VVQEKHFLGECRDASAARFLLWILYGSALVYGFILLLVLLWALGVVQRLVEMLSCNAVCVALNAISFLVCAVGFHAVSVLYGVYQLNFEEPSPCPELRLFVRASGSIYCLWLAAGLVYALFRLLAGRCLK
jgi:hypothetical protein